MTCEHLQTTMSSTNDNNLKQPTATPDEDKKLTLLALPQELRQRILLFSVTNEDISGYLEIKLLYHSRPLQVTVPYDPKRLKLWKRRLDLVHPQIQKDMVWVFKRRDQLANKLTYFDDGRGARWAAGW